MSIKHLCLICGFLFYTASQTFGSSDPVSPHIHINQIGYPLSESKIAYVSSSIALPFEVENIEREKIALKGMLQLAHSNDQVSGGHIWKADFSVLSTTGEYRLDVAGIGSSFLFRIDSHLYEDVAKQALKGFFLSRNGMELPKEYAIQWSRDPLYTSEVMVFPATADEQTPLKLAGGWYDGGDNGMYTVNGSFAAGMLLLLHEIYPQRYPDQSLPIPESGNGIPDLLDEVKWELDWLLSIQAPDGGIYHKLTPKEPTKPVNKNEKEQRYLYSVSTAATANVCAVLAKASRLYSPYNATYSITCLRSAEKAWRYLEQNPNDKGFQNPEEIITKSYSDQDDMDERFWAAVELYLATNQSQYLDIANQIGEKRVPLLSSTGYWGNVMPMAIASIIISSTPALDEKLKKEAINDLVSLADSIVETSNQEGYAQSLNQGEFSWGSNAVLLQNAVILFLADLVNSKPNYRNIMLDQVHYILGRNPLSMCYVTGIGDHSPQNPHHFLSMIDKAEEPIPGMLVGGPNQFLNDSILKGRFNQNTPSAMTYVDDEGSYASNETSLSWNAVLILVLNCLSPF